MLAPGLKVIKNSSDDIGIFDARNNLDRTAAIVTDLDINAKHPLEAASPFHRAMLLGSGQRLVC